MAYAIYETDALVLALAPVRERALSVALLTRELGFIRARAEGVRTAASKMRSNLASYAHVSVALVRGRHEWRMVGVRMERSFTGLFACGGAAQCTARIARLYGRLIPDEAAGHGMLFDDLSAGFALLDAGQVAHEALEVLLLVRALGHLGYLPDDEHLIPLMCDDCSLETLVPQALAVRSHAVGVINRALAETQL